MAALGSKRQSDEKKGAEGALLHSVGGTVFGELGPELRRPASAIAHRTGIAVALANCASSHFALCNNRYGAGRCGSARCLCCGETDGCCAIEHWA